jgi:ParB family chromosome partitioning protein
MARRRLVAPDDAEVARLRAEAAGDARNRPAPPVAQVAGETADAHGRAFSDAMARASEYAQAEAGGLVLRKLPLDAIDTGHLVRDRLATDDETMGELKRSIHEHGLRTAIEVTQLGDDAGRYGLISGWRRLLAFRQLRDETGDDAFATIKAIVVRPTNLEAAYVAMVEENEVRADLSLYERGRIAVVTTGQGLFADPAAAVDVLFASASAAKRSKIRSFAAIHDQLEGVLAFPTRLGERLGLRLADAVKRGNGEPVRAALEATAPHPDAATEQAALTEVLDRLDATAVAQRSRRGRPKRTVATTVVELHPGVRLERRDHADGIELRLAGPNLSEDLVDAAVERLRDVFAGGD